MVVVVGPTPHRLLKDEVAGHKNMNGRTYSLAGRDEIIKINQTILLTNP